ncbi:MAG: DUF167 domain-containing protein [Nisaea sp.]|uniref:DUF167 domain-containing protein n=1 Tax=Nisaea sp. TaxID=2024842 RepID=UPI001B019FE3|nr:DUF167 family protein [Nisaea sp.]MBO6562436.1 DUF167 domain-containing protein [Nisaea sp.]
MAPDPAALPFEKVPEGLRLRVRLTPNAARDGIGGVARDAEQVAWLTATVTAAPENGRANKALIKLLSKSWKIPKSSFELKSGATQRRKVFAIGGDGAELAAKLNNWLEESGN